MIKSIIANDMEEMILNGKCLYTPGGAAESMPLSAVISIVAVLSSAATVIIERD